MDPAMSEEIQAVRDMVNRFMKNEVVPVMDGYEARGEFPRELIRKAGEAGLYGAVFPESVGGSNMGYLAAAVIQEEMARNDVGRGMREHAAVTRQCFYETDFHQVWPRCRQSRLVGDNRAT